MNKLKVLLLALLACGTISSSMAASVMDMPKASAETAQTTLDQATSAGQGELDRIVAVVNNDVITEFELQERTHTVALNLRRQNIELPPMDQLRAQVLERLITERTIMQRARETGIRIDDQMVNASIEQIAAQNHLSTDQLRQRLLADGVSFSAFREEIRDEITTRRLREREVDEKIVIPDSEVDAYLAEQAGFTGNNTTQYHVQHILLPITSPAEADQVNATAQDLVKRAQNGEDFGKLVAAYSRGDDALTGGDLGWRDAQGLPSIFWDAMKNHAKVGDVYIARSQHAIHVLKLVNERDGVQAKLAGGPVEQTHVRHILMFVSDIMPEADVLRRLNDIKQRVESGQVDFATMARLNSVDTTATRGGDLGWIQAGDTVPEFEKAMNALKPGEVSAPIKTPYGYHLIQVVERRVDKSGNPQRMRIAARQALREKKLAEATYDWQRELRDQAYVEIRGQGLE